MDHISELFQEILKVIQDKQYISITLEKNKKKKEPHLIKLKRNDTLVKMLVSSLMVKSEPLLNNSFLSSLSKDWESQSKNQKEWPELDVIIFNIFFK